MTQEASSANPNPEPPYILALDIGTSSTRVLLFDATGNTFPNVLAQRPYQLRITNEGEVSVDPDALVAVVRQTIYDSLEMAGPLAQHIGAVAIDTFWHSIMGVDADNCPLTPLIIWEDTRPHQAALELREQLDEAAHPDRYNSRNPFSHFRWSIPASVITGHPDRPSDCKTDSPASCASPSSVTRTHPRRFRC